MADTVSITITFAHSPGYVPRNHPLYTNNPILLTYHLQPYPGKQFHFQIPPSTRLSELRPLIAAQYGLPIELQHSFTPNAESYFKCDEIPDTKTIVEANKSGRGIYIMTTACRIRQVHNIIWYTVREWEHLNWGLKYLQGRLARATEGPDRDNQQKALEECRGAKDFCLEKLQKMRSDLEKYTMQGDGKAALDMGEDDITAWLEDYKDSLVGITNSIAADLYIAVKACYENEKLLEDITAAELEEATSSLGYPYDNKLLDNLYLSDTGCRSVDKALQELLAKDEDKEIYISKTVQKNRDHKKQLIQQKSVSRAAVPSRDILPKKKDNIRPFDRLAFQHPSFKDTPETIGRSMRDESEARLIDGFTITSGQLLWGQLPTVIDGSRAEGFDRNAEGAPPRGHGGTIIQHRFEYRSAARNGQWKVRRAFDSGDGLPGDGRSEPNKHFGWIVYHGEVENPAELLLRCSRISWNMGGRPLGNKHIDKDILCINRYDWGYHYQPNTNIPKALEKDAGMKIKNRKGLGDKYALEMLKGQRQFDAGAMIMLDAEKYSASFLRALLRDCMVAEGEHPTEISFSERVSEEEFREFGAFLAIPQGGEWQFAWLIFSGKKHEKFKEADELIAVIYDGAQHHLDADRYAVET